MEWPKSRVNRRVEMETLARKAKAILWWREGVVVEGIVESERTRARASAIKGSFSCSARTAENF